MALDQRDQRDNPLYFVRLEAPMLSVLGREVTVAPSLIGNFIEKMRSNRDQASDKLRKAEEIAADLRREIAAHEAVIAVLEKELAK